MKLLFLDIDGVLNSHYSLDELIKIDAPEILYNAPFQEHVKWLNFIIEQTNAQVVISSTWRQNNNFYLHMILALAGYKYDIFGHTPRMRGVERGDEIKMFIEWISEDGISQYKETYIEYFNFNRDNKDINFNVDSFVVLDDDTDMSAVRDNFVLVNNYLGLNEENAKLAISILNKEGSHEERC